MEISNTETAKKTNQIILVVENSLSFYSKENEIWLKKMEIVCYCGKNGFSLNRHSGDYTSPIGSFPILYAFGTEDKVNTKLTYKKITNNSYFSDDEEKFDEYNTWVESSLPINGEHLIDYSEEYNYGIVIGFNINPKIKGKGSSIFLHCKGKKNYTAGCIAISKSDMIYLLKEINEGAYILIVPNKESIKNY